MFISVNAPYEFWSFEERLAALQPVISSDQIFSVLLQRRQAERVASTLFSAFFFFLRHPLRKGAFKGKWRKTGSCVYPVKVLGGGRMLTEQVR